MSVDLHYQLVEGGICITGYVSLEKQLQIPERIEGQPVVAIGKKAFFACKELTKVWIPKNVTKVEDWAFASCKKLNTVFCTKDCQFGKQVFLGDEELTRIECGETTMAALLAIAAVWLSADYLLTPALVGSKGWLEQFDEKLLEKLGEPEEATFNRLVYSAEEGMREQLEEELYKKKMREGYFCLERLREDLYLNEQTRSCMEDYLQLHEEKLLTFLGKTSPESKAWFLNWVLNRKENILESIKL